MKKKYKIDTNIFSKELLGFWLYLMSDCIIFCTLFSVYFILVDNVAQGPSGHNIFQNNLIIIETFLLLFSSFSCNLVLFEMKNKNLYMVFLWLGITFLLGLLFVFLELFEFFHLINLGFGPTRSGFLSSFFVLIATHGIHVISGLIWIIVMIKYVYTFNITNLIYYRMLCLNLFWHFLDIVWVFIFSFVYLFGMV
ncbi:cytochrome O ubiquinol oxidase subunit III [Buchnera aphidicola str. Bp (Baizongia pistaciae)]|uniref:Cytochrome bo(3) ubiquinol oxidase subunit 3 n=2 Tax=Buchnera aphidicola TaxID=9 RepID=CYOC_BUCBP|nr:RecName: Full=Cytochrome bo(3) ubiquinol oxidase subunit 3; AltName: Full=Cytochrome o ubiquinol oxidase subunit 3; Short=Cytochrome o subunit 3; AltName: Full=Oxidase bo(3) subunit 3; AltName: Full=Ubiquinol oxidase polypeptide III; AltName: Full=Ubiquinol oxidase subunit 3 [Buchnera aphidicola str. Bp (Baizongia pistaciae)]AAO27125.1 cytochrome O ubiquinol oxidase subunit III [Buchnera aphidicola str. Bp (Baizongia pistaciae)]